MASSGRLSTIAAHGLETEVLELRKSRSTREIAETLAKRHGIKIGHTAVSRWLADFDASRKEAVAAAMNGAASAEAESRRVAAEAGTAATEAHRAALPRDLAVLDSLRDWLHRAAISDDFTVAAPVKGMAIAVRGGKVEGIASTDGATSAPQRLTAAERIAAAKACAEVIAKRFQVTGGKPLDAGDVKRLSGNFAQIVAEQLREHHDPHATTRTERALAAPPAPTGKPDASD